jgi:hypothetical protein
MRRAFISFIDVGKERFRVEDILFEAVRGLLRVVARCERAGPFLDRRAEVELADVRIAGAQ